MNIIPADFSQAWMVSEVNATASYNGITIETRLIGISGDRPVQTLYRAVGCDRCDYQGYRGRLAVMELMRMDADLDELIARRATFREIRNAARAKGFRSLAEDGMRRVLEGVTSLEEVGRVVDLTERMG